MIKKGIFVLDGSQSMQLEYHTGPIENNPLWVSVCLVNDVSAIKAMHVDYLSAGSDIISTLTYQATIEGLAKFKKISIDEATAALQYSVQIAREAWKDYLTNNPTVFKKPIVAGSVGPFGAAMHDGSEYGPTYPKNVDLEMLINWHRPRVKALCEAGVDLLAFETIPNKMEGEALMTLLKEFPDQKAWLSFVYDKDGLVTSHEDPFAETVEACWKKGREQLAAIGCNCTDPLLIEGLLDSVSGRVKKELPFVVYPNSGEKFDSNLGWHGERVDLAKYAKNWLRQGVRYIGGCCRTNREDIQHIRRVADQLT